MFSSISLNQMNQLASFGQIPYDIPQNDAATIFSFQGTFLLPQPMRIA